MNTHFLNFWMVKYWQTYTFARRLDGKTKTFGG